MKRFFRITAVVIVVILIAIPVSFQLFKKKIRQQAEREISRYINGRVHFTDLSVSILRDFPNLTLTLEDVSVKGRGEFKKDTIARIAEFDCELSTSSLLFGKDIEIKSAAFHDLKVDLNVLPDGNANYTSIIKVQTDSSDDAASSVNLSLDRIAIDNGSVNYTDRSSNTEIAVTGLHYTGTGDFHKNIFDLETHARIDELSVTHKKIRYLDQKHVTAALITEMNLNEKRFTLKNNALQINHFKFTVEGSFTIFDDALAFDMMFHTEETSFSNIISLLPGIYMKDMEQIETAGEIIFDGVLKGLYSELTVPSFSVNLKVRDASFKLDTLPAAVEKIACQLSIRNRNGLIDSTEIDVSEFHLDMMGYPLHGKFNIKNFSNPIVDMDIFANIDLSLLERMYPIHGVDMRGKLNAELKVKGQYISFAEGLDSGTFRLKQLPAFHLNLHLANGMFKYDHLPSPINNIQLHLVADNPDGALEHTLLDLRNFHLDVGEDTIHGRIKISGYENYLIDADVRSKLDLANLEKMYPLENIILQGKVDSDIKVKGLYNAKLKKFPLVDAQASLTDGFLKLADSPDPLKGVNLELEAINTTGRFRDTRFDIKNLTYTMEDEPFQVKGSIANLDNIEYDLQIKGRVDLEKITRIYPVENWNLKGRIFSHFETQGSLADLESGHYEKLKSTGSLKIKNLECSGPLLRQPIQVKDAHFTFTPEKIVLEQMNGKFGRSNVSIKGELTDYMAFVTKKNDLISGDLDLHCDTLDLNEWYSRDSTSISLASDSSASQLTAWAVPSNLDFKFDSDIGHVFFQDMNISKLNGEINLHDGVMTLHETGFNSLNATFTVNGKYQTTNIAHPLFDFELDIQELDINKAYKEVQLIRTLAPAAANTMGQLSVSYKLKGELHPNMTPKTETLEGGGEIRIANAKINGMKIFEEISKTAKKQEMNDPHLKDFAMRTEIRNNKIFVKPFSIKLSGLNTDIEGVSELTGAINYLVQIELLPIEKLRIPFHVTGTYDKPKVAIGKGHTLPQ